MKTCPACAESIPDGAKSCPRCSESLLKVCPHCAEEIQAAAVRCKWCRTDLPMPPGAPGARRAPPPPDPEAVRRKLSSLNLTSFMLGIPGLLLHLVAFVSNVKTVAGLGTLLVILGLAFYARMKGRSGWWGLMGILSIVGIIVLARLRKRCHHCQAAAGSEERKCRTCGAPM